MRITAALLALGLAGPVAAQEVPPSPADRFSLFRWQEDYGYLDGLDRPRRGLEAIKWRSVGSLRFNLGGQVRTRLEGHGDDLFGLAAPDRDFGSAAQRLLLHGDLHWPGRGRAFLELGAYAEDGREPGPRPIDRSDPDVQQAFLDIEIGRRGDSLRLGRQEIVFGEPPTLLGLREGPNQRRAFDAARLDWRLGGGGRAGRVSVFAGRVVVPRDDAFADGDDDTESLAGAYATFDAAGPFDDLDLYWLWRRDEDEAWAQGASDERRHTLGLRLAGSREGAAGTFDYGLEAGMQVGRFGAGDIRAYAASGEIGYRLDAAWSPRLHLRADVFSGDDDPDDPDLGTFNALYPNLGYFSEATNVAPANLAGLELGVETRPAGTLTLSASATALHRLRETDALYGPNYLPLVAPGTGGEGHATTLVELSAAWSPRPWLDLTAAYVHGRAGGVIERAGGTDTNFLLLQGSLRF